MRNDGRRPRRPEESKVKMGGAKTMKKTQQNNNNRKGMPVGNGGRTVWHRLTPPRNLKEPANMDRKLPEKKNEVTSRKAATFIPKAQERGESED